MAVTPHKQSQQDFSNLAHLVAQRDLYPRLFHANPSNIQYWRCNVSNGGLAARLDGDLGIDVVVGVNYGLLALNRFSIQERFREPKYLDFDDLTVTSWNNNSGLPSELYKMVAQYFVYGVMDDPDKPTRFLRAAVVNVADLIAMRGRGVLVSQNGKRNDRGQDFEAYPISRLLGLSLMRLYFDGSEWLDYYATG